MHLFNHCKRDAVNTKRYPFHMGSEQHPLKPSLTFLFQGVDGNIFSAYPFSASSNIRHERHDAESNGTTTTTSAHHQHGVGNQSTRPGRRVPVATATTPATTTRTAAGDAATWWSA